jgi:predicted metal-dependent HD superfamily phosphohydrolase
MSKETVKIAEEHVQNLLREKSKPSNVYHSTLHTENVVENAIIIAKGSKVTEEELEIITIAAWFHDLGYIEIIEGHEQLSAEFAEKFLQQQNYPLEKIDKIKGCILATKVPQGPQNILEEILCDADLNHLGKDYFTERNDLYRLEVEMQTESRMSEYDWLKGSVEFISHHKYFTSYAKANFNTTKTENFNKLQKQFRKQLRKFEDSKVKNEKLEIEKEKLKNKQESSKKADRGIETMFRNVMRTHVSFSSMADTKANIMISVNTLILTAIVAILARKLDSNPHLIVPTLILTVVSLATLTFATFVTRPKITSGRFTKDDITNKKANLLFFGNFFNMNLNDFHWGMTELMNDRVFLYDSMIKDFYYLGQVLGHKYKYLNYCYSIFIYGMILSVLAFAVAIMLYPEGTDLGVIIE